MVSKRKMSIDSSRGGYVREADGKGRVVREHPRRQKTSD